MRPVAEPDDPLRQACQQSCEDTYRIALEAASRCIAEGGDPGIIHAMMDAADVCRANMGFLARGTSRLGLLAQACAEVCQEASASCEGLTDHSVRAFRESAAECAVRCLEVAGAAAGANGTVQP